MKASRPLYYLSLITLAVTAILVWWGATVTSKNVGMAVPDWPWSFGALFNPEGWHKVDPVFWEHSHRLIAQVVGLLVATLFFWLWRRNKQPIWEPFILFFLFVILFISLAKRQITAPNGDISYTDPNYWRGLAIGIFLLLWLISGLLFRPWDVRLKTAAVALILVVTQACLGGMRVTEISDLFGILHGNLAQIFFCNILLLVLLLSPKWKERCELIEKKVLKNARLFSTLLFALLLLQLLLGSTMRHTMRHALAIGDFPLANGKIIPDLSNFNIAVHYFHRVGGFSILILSTIITIYFFRKLKSQKRLVRLAKKISELVLVQIILGAFVIWHNLPILITNLHVVTGLAILAVSFTLLVTTWVSHPRSELIAK